MPSVVDICNEAMDLLGADTITSLTENSKEARLCNRRFDTVRDTVLRSHNWNCAISRATLAQDATAPSFGFTFQYTLPTNPFCLRVISFWNAEVNNEVAAYNSNKMFKIEGRKVLSNESSCSIIYISRVTDTETLDSLCSSVIAHRLASETAYAITGSNSVAQATFQLYQQRLNEARGMDAVEGYPERIEADEFVDVRL